MHTFKLMLSVFFMFIGFVYLYNADMVMKINHYARQFLFNDTFVLLYRKKIGVLFILVAIIIIFSQSVYFFVK